MIGKKFIQNNLIYLSSIVIGGALGYLFNFILARNLTVAQFGEFQSVVSVMMIFSIFASAFSYFTVKYSSVFALHSDQEGQVQFIDFILEKFKKPLFIAFLSYIAILPFAKQWLHLDDYWGLLIVGFTLLVSFYYSFYANSLQGWSNFFILSIIGVSMASVKLAGGYLVTNFYPSASLAFLSFLVSIFLGWQIARLYVELKWRIKMKKNGEKNGWREKYFSGVNFRKSFVNILFFSAGLTMLGNIDLLIVRNLTDAQTVGYYGALSVLGKIIFSLNMAFIGVLFPDACADGYLRQPAKMQSIIGSYLFIILMSLPLVAIFYFFSEPIINSLFGDKYLPIKSSLWMFGIMGLFLSFITLESKLSLARHDFRSTWLLLATVLIFSVGIYSYHSDLQTIIMIVTSSFVLGWLGIMALNLVHRWKFKKHINI